MNESMVAEGKKQGAPKPPLSWRRMAGEILAGTAVGFAVTLLTIYMLLAISGGDRMGFRRLSDVPFVFSPVYGLGSAVGVYLIGRICKQAGSFLSTLGWGFFGGLVMLLMLPILNAASHVLTVGVEQIVPWALRVLVSFIPSIAAAYGFNSGISGALTWFSHLKNRGKPTDESIAVEKEKQALQRPPLNSGRVAGEILAGMATGFAAGLPAAFVFLISLGRGIQASSCFGGLIAGGMAICLVFPAVYGLGSAIGVYLVGRTDKQTGSFLLTLGCGFLGGLGAIGMLLNMPLVGMAGQVENTIRLLLLLIPPILATLGFNATRRYKELPSS